MFSQREVLFVLQYVHREAVCTQAWSFNFQHPGGFGLHWLQNAFSLQNGCHAQWKINPQVLNYLTVFWFLREFSLEIRF